MKNIIEIIFKNIIFNINSKYNDIFLNNSLLNISFNFLYFLENKYIKNADYNIIYIEYINKYTDYINKYHNFDISPLPIEILIEIFNYIDYDLIKKELINKSFIEHVYDFTKNNKQYKIFTKYLEPYIINYKMIMDSKTYYNLDNIDSIMLLFSGLGELYLPLINIKYNNLYIYDRNININLLFALNNKISYGVDIENNIVTSNIIHDNIINKKVDLIICNIPLDFKNIIYTNCNNLIKNLKIRGTKAEPLILQLIIQLVNKNGTIMLYTPTSLLFGESNQHIETRKYLLENFSIEKIIELENKKSLIIIKNNKDCSNIQIIKNNIIFNVNKEHINKENYLLDFYQINNEINTYYEKKNLNDIVLIKSNNDLDNNIITNKILYNYKFNDFNIDFVNNIQNYNYLFLTKDENIIKQDFLNLYLINFFNKNLEIITKGKMSKISIEMINELELNILPIKTQELILHQIELNNITINNNNLQITNFIELLNKFIDGMILDTKKEKINYFFYISSEVTSESIIAIKKNSLTVGIIDKIDNTHNYKDNMNYFYLSILNKNNNVDYFYYLLKYYKNEFIYSAFKNKSVGLSKTFVELLEIPVLSIEEQNHFVSICEYFYKQIEILDNNNNLLKETNIISLII
jgi:hypothetical protein